MRSFTVQTIPHDTQRYETCGDWLVFPEKGEPVVLKVYVSDLHDWRMSMCIGIHEAIEAMLCVNDGVREADVSAFDIAYERARQDQVAAPCGCVPTWDSEPGEDRHAPYRKQHAFADAIERLLARELGIVWDEYSEKVCALDWQGLNKPEGVIDPLNMIHSDEEYPTMAKRKLPAALKAHEFKKGQKPGGKKAPAKGVKAMLKKKGMTDPSGDDKIVKGKLVDPSHDNKPIKKGAKKKGTLFGKPKGKVVKHPGVEKAAAKKAGMSTHAFMEKKKNAPGTAGKRARLGLALSKMSKKKAKK